MEIWNDEEVKELWRKFFRGEVESKLKYGPMIREAADNFPEMASIDVHFTDVVEYMRQFAEYIIKYPRHAIELGEAAMKDFMHVDRKVRLVMHIIDIPESMTKVEIRNIRANLLDCLVSIEALVRRVTEVRPRITNAVFKCKRCNELISVIQRRREFEEPLFCPKDQGGCGRAASATRFILIKGESTFIDTQSIDVQEYPEGLRGGAQPQRLAINVEADLTDKVYPGDRVVFNGILQSRQLKGWGTSKSTLFERYLECRGISRSQEDYEEIKISPDEEKRILEISKSKDVLFNISSSIATSIQGMKEEKLALALQLFGGVRKEIQDGYLRGDIHLLLVGDPGTAKSQLLNYIQKMSPRGVMTTGKSSTAAGLTAAAIPDEHEKGRWNLEAGALVLADMGIVCIDEIDKMSNQDRSSMHEAMEQQRVTVTKAGIQATLQSRCAVLGAANPKMGRFTSYSESLVDEINMSPTLLDRFDMIFTIQDIPNRERDENLAKHVLRTHRYGEIKRYREVAPYGRYGKKDLELSGENIEPIYNREFLKKYIAYAKKHVFPVLTEEAMHKIKEYYVEVRSRSREEVVTCTARQLEALVRFSEACARAHLSDEVTTAYVDVAIGLVRYYLEKEASLDKGGIDRIIGPVTHSQKVSISNILKFIQDLEDETEDYSKNGVPEEEIILRCEKEGIERSRVQVMIDKMNQIGSIYSKGYKKGARRWKLIP